jgi:hypothetical protein
MTRSQVIDGLKYIANSPSPKNGGFHPEAVKIAKAALGDRRTRKWKSTMQKIDYDKLADEFFSVIAHASAGSDFDDVPMAVRGCIEEVKKEMEKIFE